MMRMIVAGLVAAIVALGAPARLSAQSDQPYLFDLLKRPAFKDSWDNLFRRNRNVDRWVHVFGGGGNGVSGPAELVAADGRRFLSTDVCKPHDCADNQLFVLFTADGSRAWATLRHKDFVQWFGNPGPVERRLLEQRLAR
ncbi:MAG: hypothetical protein JNK84_02720 [Phreatobacter sp.]|uniref:Ivy family c-type lysozyme inhibitor n=1 Tax=Phreatobacter sp. TaxID=1966341 RepID=UPI001A640B85|nr:Ivy family c-type lysozyme inhibitor [Phreatobacter sp.]MBL8567976.1 hypothetical protein [Phreatobacter sp.]